MSYYCVKRIKIGETLAKYDTISQIVGGFALRRADELE